MTHFLKTNFHFTFPGVGDSTVFQFVLVGGAESQQIAAVVADNVADGGILQDLDDSRPVGVGEHKLRPVVVDVLDAEPVSLVDRTQSSLIACLAFSVNICHQLIHRGGYVIFYDGSGGISIPGLGCRISRCNRGGFRRRR